MGVSFIPGVNVIDVGHALEARLQQMAADKPAGIDIAIFYDQAAEVAHSVNGFITNFLMALAIVVGVLLVFMGVRSGIIIALSLALNVLGTLWSWRACYAFLLVLCAGVTFSMAKWMPETRPEGAPRTKLLASYKTLFGTGAFNCYLLMLIGGLAGIAVFEACSGVLMGAVLGLSSMAVSILFILPIPAAFFGAWFAGRPNKRFPTLMWQSVICCLLAGLMMWIPGLLGIMTVWTLLVPAALFFFGAGMLFPLATSGAMEPFPFLAGTAGALVGGLQNIGSGVLAWLSAMMPQTGQGSLGLLMMLMGLLILLCWLPLASRFTHHQQPV